MGSMSDESSDLKLPKVDLSGLGSCGLGTEAWAIAQEKVAHALANYGSFEAVFNDVDAELREELFGRALPELFQEEAKYSSAPLVSRSGFLFLRMSGIFKSLQIESPESLDNVKDFAATLWPQGNDFFCNTVCDIAKYVQGLEQIIQRIILTSLGLEDHYMSHIKSMVYSMRLSEYFEKVPDNETETRMPAHVDPNYINIIFQNNVGLEVESQNGEWIRTASSSNSFTVILGEAFMAWTNGRLKAPKHRVKILDSAKRYSITFSSLPSPTDDTIKTLDELVDEKHPLVYKPFKYYDYLNFRISSGVKEEGLKSFCGVEQEQVAA